MPSSCATSCSAAETSAPPTALKMSGQAAVLQRRRVQNAGRFPLGQPVRRRDKTSGGN